MEKAGEWKTLIHSLPEVPRGPKTYVLRDQKSYFGTSTWPWPSHQYTSLDKILSFFTPGQSHGLKATRPRFSLWPPTQDKSHSLGVHII